MQADLLRELVPDPTQRVAEEDQEDEPGGIADDEA